MFYIKKIKNENEAKDGDRVMVLADFSGISAGQKGKVYEVYPGGLTIEWDGALNAITGQDVQKNPVDGFSRDELKYLGFETIEHPETQENKRYESAIEENGISEDEYKNHKEEWWIGRRVKTLRPIRNGFVEIPAGTELEIERKYCGFGLKGTKVCEHCNIGRRISISRVQPKEIELIN